MLAAATPIPVALTCLRNLRRPVGLVTMLSIASFVIALLLFIFSTDQFVVVWRENSQSTGFAVIVDVASPSGSKSQAQQRQLPKNRKNKFRGKLNPKARKVRTDSKGSLAGRAV
jgi:hypothetical protein